MAFVSVPKDLTKVKTKVAFNLTKRQLICFGSAAIIGIPIYIFTRGTIGNSAAVILMMIIMLPLFFMGIYEKDGLSAEIIARNYIRVRFAWVGKRPYKTENLYEILTNGNVMLCQNASVGAKQRRDNIAIKEKTAKQKHCKKT